MKRNNRLTRGGLALRTKVAVIAASAVTLLGLSLFTAQAGTRASATTTVTASSPESTLPAASLSECTYKFTFNNYTGTFLCNASVWGFTFSNGTSQLFGIGTDSAVWTAWNGSNGWHSLGGRALVGFGPVAWSYPSSEAVVKVEGTDYNYWCRTRDASTGAWAGWQMCNGETPPTSGVSSFCVVNCGITTSFTTTRGRAYRQDATVV